jgi:hypothetical protein
VRAQDPAPSGLEVVFQGLENQAWALSYYHNGMFLWVTSREEQAKRSRMVAYPLVLWASYTALQRGLPFEEKFVCSSRYGMMVDDHSKCLSADVRGDRRSRYCTAVCRTALGFTVLYCNSTDFCKNTTNNRGVFAVLISVRRSRDRPAWRKQA